MVVEIDYLPDSSAKGYRSGMIALFKKACRRLAEIPGILAGMVEAVDRVSQSVQEARSLLPETHALTERLDALERSYTRILGEVEVLVDRAESKLAAARGAEERARGMERRAEALRESVDGDEEGAEPLDLWADNVRAGNGGGGEEGRVRYLPEDVAPPLTGKQAAKAFKWGGVE